MNHELKAFNGKTIMFSTHIQMGVPVGTRFVRGVGTMNFVNGGITIEITEELPQGGKVTWINLTPEQIKKVEANPTGPTDFVLLESQ